MFRSPSGLGDRNRYSPLFVEQTVTAGPVSNPDQKPGTRRWLKFSLRTTLLLVTLAAIWLAWFVQRVQKQKAAAKWIQSFGRNAFYTHMRKPKGQRNPPAPQWLIDTFGIDTFASIDMVWLDDKPVENIDMVRNLPNINHFELTNGKLTDISPLSGLTKLQHISISKNQISDLRPLADLLNLKRFYAYQTQINDVSPLSKLTNLENVILSQTPLTDISHLSSLTKLTNLELRETNIDDVSPLFGLTNLKTLNVSGTQISRKQLVELRRRLPNCKVTY